jgi:adenylate cyclase
MLPLLSRQMNAWIETSGNRIAIEANCYFGRAQTNTVRLETLGASRRHAHIHAQQAENRTEYWLADLGSTNGTLCNGKRITIPHRLKNGDLINIMGECFVFRLERETATPFAANEAPATVVVRANPVCWLLMVDIKRYTNLSRQLDTNDLSLKVGTWLRRCRDAVESAGGVVDKFLGDAIFAYWKNTAEAPALVVRALSQLIEFQKQRDPDFRIVVHRAPVTLEGGAGGANNLSGPEIIYTFRLEKVCSALGADTIVSAAASTALTSSWSCESMGRHPLDGFPGTHEVFQLVT